MHASLKVLSLLLSYPTEELQAAVPEFVAVLVADPLLDQADRNAVMSLATDIAELDLYEAQERYVYLFDRTRSLSLHLFEHVHGESRDRGQAMVGLMEMYEANGLEIDAKELPDYLPLFLEYLSTRPTEEACAMLGQASHIAAALAERLRKRESVYAKAFDVLVSIALAEPDAQKLEAILEQAEDDPSDLEALDQIWTEESVRFGGSETEQRVGLNEIRAELKAGSHMAANRKQSINPETPREVLP